MRTLSFGPLSAPLDKAAILLQQASPLRRAILAFGAGAFSALSFAPFGIFPLLLLGYAALVLLLDGAVTGRHPLRNTAIAGWAFGVGQFLVGLYWVAYAFLVDPGAHAWEIPFVEVLLPSGLALFPALAALMYAAFWREGASRIFLFALAFGAAEYFRGHAFTGFPWNLSAYGWSASLSVLQSTAYVGAYGLSLLTLLFGASLALLAVRKSKLLPAAMTILFLALWAGGEARLAYANDATVPGVRLRIVQPGVPQNEKYLPQYRARNWQLLMALSRRNGGPAPTHIIWPEAAPPFLLAQEESVLTDVATLTANGTVLLTGVVRAEHDGEDAPRFFNSFYVFGPNARLLATYDKFHLVPFGEYMPWQKTMDEWGLTKVTGGPGGFAAGDGPRTLAIPGAPPASPLICYEIIFPGEVTGVPRPQWLVNVTDDSWFGQGAGPRQHLLSARVRAIEEGLPIARAASTGISAVIDGYGRVRARLALGREDALDSPLPVALAGTFFVRFGDAAFLVLLLCFAGAAVWPLRMRRP